jgi:hypothetical protein
MRRNFLKKISRGLAVGLFSLSCGYGNFKTEIPEGYAVRYSEDGKRTFVELGDSAFMVGSYTSESMKDDYKGVIEIEEKNPEHGKLFSVRFNYGLFGFKAYDGYKSNKRDGLPDFLQFWLKGDQDNIYNYEVPDGAVPDDWPYNNIHSNAISVESELIKIIKEDFGYKIELETREKNNPKPL